MIARRNLTQDTIIYRPLRSNRSRPCNSPEIQPCAICYMRRIPCHCHEYGLCYEHQDIQPEYYSYVFDIIYTLLSVVL